MNFNFCGSCWEIFSATGYTLYSIYVVNRLILFAYNVPIKHYFADLQCTLCRLSAEIFKSLFLVTIDPIYLFISTRLSSFPDVAVLLAQKKKKMTPAQQWYGVVNLWWVGKINKAWKRDYVCWVQCRRH